MLKVLIWHVWNSSKETDFKDKAIKILQQQNNGIEIVGEAVNADIAKVDWGGIMIFSCASAQKKSA